MASVNRRCRLDARLERAAGRQPDATPFMRHEYLAALHASGSAVPDTGWTPRFLTLWDAARWCAACPLYLKDPFLRRVRVRLGLGQRLPQHGLRYYPKALVRPALHAGARCAAAGPRRHRAGGAAAGGARHWCAARRCRRCTCCLRQPTTTAGLRRRRPDAAPHVQFHWTAPRPGSDYSDFDDFLASLSQDKRKKIRQERRKVPRPASPSATLRGATSARATGTSSTAATNAPTSSTATRPTSAATSSTAWRTHARGLAAVHRRARWPPDC
jgi:predicted N-acyltransferase